MELINYNKAIKIRSEIDIINIKIAEIENNFNCTLVGEYQNKLESALVLACKDIFRTEFANRLAIKVAEFDAL